MPLLFDQAPYNDDFDEFAQYYKVLFKPGVSVQTREMNQLQTILQNQITKFGNHMFRNGSMVIPGNVQYNDKLSYVKLQAYSLGTDSNGNALTLSWLEGKILSTGSDGTGVRARVIKAVPATGTDPDTLVVLYMGSNQTPDGVSTDTIFPQSTTLYSIDTEGTIYSTKVVTTRSGGDYAGRSAVASIQSGVYYLGGYFVSVTSDVISVKTYADTVTDINARIGLQYEESIVTANDDTALYDNAFGTPNYAAPGADRYKITPYFVQIGLDESPTNFFELIRIQDGVLQNLVNASQYNILEDTLARRTYDEAGNYIVNEFKFDLREARSNNQNTWTGGTYYQVNDYIQVSSYNSSTATTSTGYFVCVQGGQSALGTAAPSAFGISTYDDTQVITDNTVKWRKVTNPIGNRGIDSAGDSSNLTATFGIGKAYVQGYEINKITNSTVTIPKARDTRTEYGKVIYTQLGNYALVDKTQSWGLPDISTAPVAFLYDRTVGLRNETYKFGHGIKVGTARLNWIDNDNRGAFKVGLTDIKMYQGKGFDRDVNSIVVPTDPTSTSYQTTSVTLTGTIRYTGYNATTYITASGGLSTSSVAANTLVTVTGTSTLWNQEFAVGDTITVGTAAYGATSSWVIQSIASATQMVIKGSAFTTFQANTANLVSLGTSTVLGIGGAFGTTTRFSGELRPGDTVFLQTASASNLATVTNIYSDNRMQVSSTLAAITGTAQPFGVFYQGIPCIFTGDVYSNYQQGLNARKLTGSYTLTDHSGAASTIGPHSSIRITGTLDAKLLTEIVPNDLISVNNQRIFVTKISSNTIAYGVCLDTAVAGNTSNIYPAFRINNQLQETSSNSLVFPANTAMYNLYGNTFTVYKTVTVTSNTLSATTITVPLTVYSSPDATETIATYDPTAYSVAATPASGSGLSVPYTVTGVSVGTNIITLTIAAGLGNTQNLTVVYPVNRGSDAGTSLGRLRTKTLTYSQADDYLTSSAAVKTVLSLTKADVYKVVKVLMATGFVASWDTATTQVAALDITNRYDVDYGQRPGHYDYGSIRLRPGFPLPTGSVRVYYDYFEHGTGDYFARNSYSSNQVIYEAIQAFNGVNLGDCLDFRNKVTNVNTSVVTGQCPPRYGTNFQTTLQFYLGRRTQIFLDKSESFYAVSGISDINPKWPNTSENANAISLYKLDLAPYTKSANYPNVLQEKIDNRRYTMKDIGRIEKRVSNLETTTALSLLEAKTKNLQIRDNVDNTLERYKTGFFVDNFSDASNADHLSGSRFAIDFKTQTLYPSVEYHQFPLIEKINFTASTTSTAEETNALAARQAANYAVTGDLMTLNYGTSSVLKQMLATTSVSIAPFASVSWLGNLRIIPDSDLYTNVRSQDKIIGNVTTNTIADAINAYRATRNWRPYHLVETVVNVPAGTDVQTDLIPFCRANTILMIAKGLKPNTKYYTFFDDEDVRDYVTGAVKLPFDSVPVYNLENIRASAKTDTPRFRSLYESLDLQEVVRARWVRFSRRYSGWVYDYGWFHRTRNPRDYEKYLPSSAYRDAHRNALGIGAAVWCYEGSRQVGTGVAVYQDIATGYAGSTTSNVYVVNGRGKLSPTYIRSLGTGGENFSTKTFYIGANGVTDTRKISNTIYPSTALTDDTDGFLYSDSKGTICALFDLPDTDTVKFITGKKPLVITDSPTNDPDNWSSRAQAFYTVEGWNVLITYNYISTKSYSARPYDPIAQSFKLPSQYTNGAFITDIDIYFQQKPVADQAPVVMEIRTCDTTGRPSSTEILPGTEVIKFPADINANDNSATLLGQAATNFKFKQPVYLLPDKNYAFVLKSDSPMYKVWAATLGQADVNASGNSTTYSTQATLGSLFKSQDGTLWTEDQFTDLKFNINRAVFPTGVNGTAYVVNHTLPTVNLPQNPFTFIHGSKKVRVGLKDHGFAEGDQITFTSEYWREQYAAGTTTMQGIPLTDFFGRYVTSTTLTGGVRGLEYIPDPTDPLLTISDVTMDTFTITVSTNAYISADATTGITSTTNGGTDINSYSQYNYQIINPSVNLLSFQPTSIDFTARMLQGITYDNNDGSTTGSVTPAPYQWVDRNLNLNQSNLLNTSRVVLASINEINRTSGISIGGSTWSDSFIGTITMSTTDDAVSPAIDLSTFHADTTNNRIDNPSVFSRLYRYGSAQLPSVVYGTGGIAYQNTSQVLLITPVCVGNTSIGFAGSGSTIYTSTNGLFSNVVAGRYVYVSGSTASVNNNTTTGWLVTSVASDSNSFTVSGTLASAVASSPVTILQYDDYTDELTYEDGTGESKYITRKINLANPASQLKLLLDVCIPTAADFDVYYKIGASTADFSTILWNKYTDYNTNSSYASIVRSDIRDTFSEKEFDITGFDALGNPTEFSPFTAFQIKLVMRSSNASRVPQLKNMRVIAHA